eukprot:SAG22_NODE_103_length_20175_cov_15.280833_10_plen_172_part_00
MAAARPACLSAVLASTALPTVCPAFLLCSHCRMRIGRAGRSKHRPAPFLADLSSTAPAPSTFPLQNISNLSGGEKTLSSLALVFALHHFKPTPLYFMDEIDAALDFKNVSIVAHYIKERTKNAQFIIISLRNNMFELADRLVGIYKTHNCTKSVTINPSTFAVPQQQALTA